VTGLAVVCVNHDAADKVVALIISLGEATPTPDVVVVVDNGSTPFDAGLLPPTSFPVKVERAENHGFGAGVNLGVSLTDGHAICVANPDTRIIDASVLGDLVTALEQPGVGMAVPSIVRPDGTAEWTVSPDLPSFADSMRRKTAPTGPPPRQPSNATGAFFAMRRADFERLGGFDEGYFLYFEDADLCARLRDAGLTIRRVDARVEHEVGGTGHDARRNRWYRQSQQRYFRKWRPRWEARAIRAIATVSDKAKDHHASAASLDDATSELQRLDEERGQGIGPWASIVAARQYRWLVGAIEDYAAPGALVFDWGCGQGYFSYWLVREGFGVIGMDLHRPAMEDELERLTGGTYEFVEPSDPVRLPLPDAAVDVVTSVGVLEHVRETGGNEAASLAEIHRVLRPNGLFVCGQLPNQHSWIEALVRRFFPGKHAHRFRYTKSGARAMVETAGFDVVATTRYGFFPRNSLVRLPGRLRNSRTLADVVDATDRSLSVMLGPITQNHGLVARKR
jgi:GT2 family glycosyltransferase/ubiquinone/menaquinone biosynthesis C-methylase UbiE